jgi:hypothetical protein
MADDKRMQSYTEFLKTKAAELKQREQLWHSINNYINASDGAWVTSPQGNSRYMTIEATALSEVPIRLAERGFKLKMIGSGTRITSSNIALPVTVFETKLG